MNSLSNDPEHPDAIANRSSQGGKVLKIGFNGIAALFQLILAGILVAAVWFRAHNADSSVATIELEMAGSCAAILIAIALPFTTLAALLGMRKRYGAARLAGQPRKVFTWDMLALVVCFMFLFSPVALLVAVIFMN